MISLFAVFALSAAASASSASAECYKVAEKETGNYKTRSAAGVCEEKGAKREYIKAKTVTQIKPGEWCAKVEEAGTGNKDISCVTNEGASKNEYIKVMAACFRVAEPKTGNFETSAKCEKKEEKAGSEWVRISKLENEVPPAGSEIWCAKVAIAGTGTYKDAKCTEAMAKGEYIKVLVSSDEWEVCEKGGTEEWSEHKCNAGKGTGEWSWKVLAAGKSYKVTSKKVAGSGPEVLKVGTLTISCTEVTNKGTITGPGKDLAENITFTGCTTGTTGCAVHSPGQPNGTIVLTNIPTKLEQRLVGEEEILVDNFEQNATTKEFVTLEFSGEPCKAAKYVTTKVKGNVAAEVKNLANGEVELDFPEPELPGNTLEAFGAKALFISRDELSLENEWALRAR
jgi:hypothetical protein